MSRSDRRHRQQATVGQSRTGRTVALLLLSGILSAAATPVATLAQSAPVERPAPADPYAAHIAEARSEEHTSELQSLMRISYAVFCLKKTTKTHKEYMSQKTNVNTK